MTSKPSVHGGERMTPEKCARHTDNSECADPGDCCACAIGEATCEYHAHFTCDQALSSRDALLRRAGEALEQIAKMPCLMDLLGDEYPDGCGCASCIAKAALSSISAQAEEVKA